MHWHLYDLVRVLSLQDLSTMEYRSVVSKAIYLSLWGSLGNIYTLIHIIPG